jgi:hypothetical protein
MSCSVVVGIPMLSVAGLYRMCSLIYDSWYSNARERDTQTETHTSPVKPEIKACECGAHETKIVLRCQLHARTLLYVCVCVCVCVFVCVVCVCRCVCDRE